MNFEGFCTGSDGMNAVRRGTLLDENRLDAVRREFFLGGCGAGCVSFKVLFRVG